MQLINGTLIGGGWISDSHIPDSESGNNSKTLFF